MRHFILINAFIFLLSGCTRLGPDVLTVTMSLGEEEWKVLREEIFPIFEDRYNVKIESYQIESGQLATKLEALKLAGQSEIDVFAQDNMNLAVLVNKNLISDLTSYENKISKEVLPNLVEACKFGGRLMFMPFRPNVQIVYYNEEAFNKYNLSPPKDWDELAEVAKTFKVEEARGRILIKGFGGNSTATQVYEFILQAGGRPYSFNDEGCVKAFEFLQKLSPYLSIESKRAKWDTTNDILARQEAYLAQNWPFGVVILVKRYGLEFIKTYSGWQGPVGEFHVIGGDVFGIPKNCKNKELALKFIFFMQTREVQEILVSRLGWPSIRTDAYAEVQDWQKPYFESVKQALKHGVFRENITWWPVYEKYINEAFREIVMEGAPVEETLNKYKEKLEKEKAAYK
jgi:trehalose transport system substrate-binding protein